MENFSILSECENGKCLSSKSTAVLVAVVCLMGCLSDFIKDSSPVSGIRDHLESLKKVLFALFQIANVCLLVGSIAENTTLLQMYLCYMLGFIIISFVVTILDLCFSIEQDFSGSFVIFITDVVYLFVLSQCLPLIDAYKRNLDID